MNRDLEQKTKEELEKLEIQIKQAEGWNEISRTNWLKGKREGLIMILDFIKNIERK